MVTDVAETVETRWHSHQQLHQPHKLKGYVGREWRQTLQGTLLQGREVQWQDIQYSLSLQIVEQIHLVVCWTRVFCYMLA